jgi:uncharacterized protein
MTPKKRFLYYELKELVDHKNAIVVTGMRQVGKTTLLRQLSEDLGDKPKMWFDLDNPLDMKVFEDVDYNAIYQRLHELCGGGDSRLFIFIDEIQNAPDITKVMKYLIDHYQVKFFVTGSASFYLKNLFSESLSGRKFLYVLQPLSFEEYLYFAGDTNLPDRTNKSFGERLDDNSIFMHKPREAAYLKYIRFGGYPEVVTTKDDALKVQVLTNIFSSFFEKDLRILSDYSDIRELRDLILLLVPRVGSLLDVTRLSEELGVSRAKIYSYLDFLQGTFMITLVPKFSHSIDRTVAGGKKVYFTDTGLLQIIGQLSEGQLFENTIANQLANYAELSFYNKRNIAEIDFILDKKVGVEVKTTATERDYKNLYKLSSTLKLDSCYVATKNYSAITGTITPVIL